VRVRLDGGRVVIGGAVVASGYLGSAELTAAHFSRGPDGTAWFRTEDTGELDGGVLTVTGRADDVLITGGVKVSAAAVAAAIEAVPGVDAVLVAGVEDPEWGTRVACAVVGRAPEERIRDTVRAELGPAAAPRTILVLDELPLLSNGKPDRLAVARMLQAAAG
jgi:O-succinylbenzoic acid--CoA ligase